MRPHCQRGLAAASGGGAEARNTIGTITRAYVQNSTVTRSGDLNIHADHTATATSTTRAAAVSIGISLAAAGSVTVIDVTPTVSAFISGGTVKAEDISLRASTTPKSTATANGLAAGALAVGASRATINLTPTISTSVSGNVTAKSLSTQAISNRPSSGRTATVTGLGSTGGLIGVDSTKTIVNHGGTISSTVANSTVLIVSGATSITAASNATSLAKADSYVLGLLAAGIASSEGDVHNRRHGPLLAT